MKELLLLLVLSGSIEGMGGSLILSYKPVGVEAALEAQRPSYLSMITNLQLAHCSLKAIPQIVSGMASVKMLDLNGNPLESLAGLPENVETLYCSRTDLHSLQGCPALTKLRCLYLRSCCLQTLKDGVVFPKLETLYLEENELNSFEGITTEFFPVLKEVYMGNNPLNSLAGAGMLPDAKVVLEEEQMQALRPFHVGWWQDEPLPGSPLDRLESLYVCRPPEYLFN